MTHFPTPEEALDQPQGPPLALELVCNGCGDCATHALAFAVISPEAVPGEPDDWDGIFLSRIVACPHCGAVDDYAMSARSREALITETLKGVCSKLFGRVRSESSRVMLGVTKLWDGTIARRPSQALAHLRQLTAARPDSAEAWRRLGNAEERFGALPAAELAWHRAVEIDPTDLEATFSLVQCLAESDRWPDAVGYLRTAIRLLPQARDLDPAHRLGLSESLTILLRRLLDVTDEPVALMASWLSGADGKMAHVSLSSVDLRKLTSWDRLAEFLVDPQVAAVDLVAELPEEEPTLLQRLLSASEPALLPASVERVPPQLPVVRVLPRIGRNAPCPCGSGKKHKKCCGGH